MNVRVNIHYKKEDYVQGYVNIPCDGEISLPKEINIEKHSIDYININDSLEYVDDNQLNTILEFCKNNLAYNGQLTLIYIDIIEFARRLSTGLLKLEDFRNILFKKTHMFTRDEIVSIVNLIHKGIQIQKEELYGYRGKITATKSAEHNNTL